MLLFDMTYLLGIESSCDDFGLAVLNLADPQIVYSAILHQSHKGGVYPEMAARAHAILPWDELEKIYTTYDITAVAVTSSPGLAGSLYIGTTIAKTIAMASNASLIAVNHVDAHILTPIWYTNLTFPYLALVVSGGHTLLAWVEDIDRIEILGSTRDDAAGEVFDKSARMIGLPYPGGPEIEKLALTGSIKYQLPIPMKQHPGYDFSFSGLKDAIRRGTSNIQNHERADWAATIQNAITQALLVRLEKAIKQYTPERIALVGGVAANEFLRSQLACLCLRHNATLFVAPHKVCGDNAEMIAWLGWEKFKRKEFAELNFAVEPRYWRLKTKTRTEQV